MRNSIRAFGALFAALVIIPAASAGTSALCAASGPFTRLSSGPARDSHQLVGSKVNYSAYQCYTSYGTLGCAAGAVTIKAGTKVDGAWVAGPTTLATGASFNGSPQTANASQTLGSSGRVHVAAIGVNCDGLEFTAQKAPTIAVSVISAPHSYAGLNYYIVGESLGFDSIPWIDAPWTVAPAASVTWSFDDGSASMIGTSATHAYAKAGEYSPSAIANDGAFNSPSSRLGLWVRGPAQPPDTLNASLDCENADGPIAYINWERTGTSFEVQRSFDGTTWTTIYAGASPAFSLPALSRETLVLQVRALDPDYGAASDYRGFTVNLPRCRTLSGDVPL